MRETRSWIGKFTHQAAQYNSNTIQLSVSESLLKINQSHQNIILIMLHVKLTENDLLTAASRSSLSPKTDLTMELHCLLGVLVFYLLHPKQNPCSFKCFWRPWISLRTVINLPHTRELCLIPHQICDWHLSLQKGTVNTDVTTSPSQGLSSHLAKDAETQKLCVHVCVCFLVLSCLLVSVLCNIVTSAVVLTLMRLMTLMKVVRLVCVMCVWARTCVSVCVLQTSVSLDGSLFL